MIHSPIASKCNLNSIDRQIFCFRLFAYNFNYVHKRFLYRNFLLLMPDQRFSDNMRIHGRSVTARKYMDNVHFIFTTFIGIILGFLVGLSFITFSPSQLDFVAHIKGQKSSTIPAAPRSFNLKPYHVNESKTNLTKPSKLNDTTTTKIWDSSKLRGAERLPPTLAESKSDLYLRRLWGDPNEDLIVQPKYLVAFTVGITQRRNVNAAVKKFSGNFTILLFHYDGRVNEWDVFEWSKHAIHVSVPKQTKWWYAKRFLHPDIVAPYEYIFIWDEDLGVEHFNAEEYIKLVKKYGLEISQPGLEPNKFLTWEMTKRRVDTEVHKVTIEKPGWCPDPHLPPCAAFVEIMAPAFSREAWRCVWHLIQNDLVHGWGLDFNLRKCVEPAHEKIGVVDAQWIDHQFVPSLGNQGQAEDGKPPWMGVRARCKREWKMFLDRVADSEAKFYKSMGLVPPNSTSDRLIMEKLTSYH